MELGREVLVVGMVFVVILVFLCEGCRLIESDLKLSWFSVDFCILLFLSGGNWLSEEIFRLLRNWWVVVKSVGWFMVFW